MMTRRQCLFSLAAPVAVSTAQDTPPKDWVCPMDPEVRADKPGKCPRCGMKLTLSVPDRIEYPLELTQSPELLRPGQKVTLTFRILDPASGKLVRKFEVVHEKLMHVFLVSENLEYFAHEHPEFLPDGSFRLSLHLPNPGMYRILADFYPAGSVPQLAVTTLFVAGPSAAPHLLPSLQPSKAANLTATLRTELAEPLAGLETRLIYTLNPADDLQPYLGAWGHMLVASADLIDLLHVHPFLVRSPDIQFNVIFPRPGLYRIWTQFQRSGVVNTTTFTLAVKGI